MSRIIQILDQEEASRIEKYCIDKINPYKGYKARDFATKCKDLSFKNGSLLFNSDEGTKKIVIYEWMHDKIFSIISEHHGSAHINSTDTHRKIYRFYIGITKEHVIDFIRKCKACNQASTKKNKR